jgi:hypothetical protein
MALKMRWLVALGASSVLWGTIYGCGSSSSSGNANVNKICQDLCNKETQCFPGLVPTDCVQQCVSGPMEEGCTQAQINAIGTQFQACLPKDCQSFQDCLNAIDECSTSGTGGGTGSSGSGNTAGKGGASASGGMTGFSGFPSFSGSTGTGGAPASGDCSECVHADACCEAILAADMMQDAGTCDFGASCDSAPASAQAQVVQICAGVLASAAQTALPACQ